jgi:SHS2 domain-containing protein
VGHSGFEEIPHTADWAIRIWAPDLTGLCVQAARGMNALMGVELIPESVVNCDFYVEAADNESLLIAFLNRLLYEIEINSAGFNRFSLVLNDHVLQARLEGGYISRIDRVIKAATFHNLHIVHNKNQVETVIVFDV